MLSQAISPRRALDAATVAALLLILFNPLGIDLYLSALPAIERHFQANVSASISVFVFSLGLGQLLFGPLADRFGRRPVALLGLVLYAASAGLASLTTHLSAFLLLRLAQGLGASASSVCAFAVIRDRFAGDAAARRYNLLNGALNIVPALAPVLGGWLSLQLGWQSCFWLLTVSALAAAGLLAWQMPETRIEQPGNRAPLPLIKVLAHPAMLRHGFCCCTSLGLIISYVTLAPTVLIARGGVGTTDFGLLFGGNALLIMAASFVSLRTIGRFKLRHVLRTGLACMLLAGGVMLALSGQAGAWHYMLPVGILGIGFACTLGPAGSLAMAPFGAMAGRAAAVLGCSQMLFASALSATLAALPLPPEWALGGAIILLVGTNLLLQATDHA
ncbi:multidrug effflux MFS transporter [Paludibacterium purpuratum]|uniref:Bcr/CflA family efflux transporter n=1 Tax=Paludibacterium purpuratum TaxID=1144873 RepID=A0A4R7B9G3_9NEIS|nr:multidrug effflux MFS transporter [Paludibacterium purpuratum]TDR80227.1 DHA1 family bicyclomycin/chloramphenicol resistance-like MFS transporter/DHA1 family florfenicol/chloramphenicol resistance protein-like MFS transporter [Paludibacterium purpuratum]